MTRPKLEAPGAVCWIVETLESAGHETWVVGGAIRDGILRVQHDDWDLATQARPGRVRRLFARTVPIGIDHGTVGVLSRDGTLYEVTTFRRDVETFGRRAVVEFADRLEDDLARRDFTINAVAWHPIRDELKDPFGGLADLEQRLLRTVGEPADRFSEDFLRVLRALRFAGRYELDIDPATWVALCGATVHLPILSPERIRDELLKVLTLDPTPSRSLRLYEESGALAVAFPELQEKAVAEAVGSNAGWTRSLQLVDALRATRPFLRLAALLEGTGAQNTAAFLVRLRFSNAQTRDVSEVVAALDGSAPPETAEGARRWLAGVGPGRLNDWTRVRGAGSRATDGVTGQDTPARVAATWRRLRKIVSSGAPLSVDALALTGRDLIRMGLRPGPAFGRILDALLDRVLTDPGLNRKEALEALAEELARPEGPVGADDGTRREP